MSRHTNSDIEQAIRTVASLIDRFGDAYWPILERLERELDARKSRAARLRKYLDTPTLENPANDTTKPRPESWTSRK